MNIKDTSKRRPAPGDRYETKDSLADVKGYAVEPTSDAEWDALERARQARVDAKKTIQVTATDSKGRFTPQEQAYIDAQARRLADHVKIERRAREKVAEHHAAQDAATISAASKLERIGAISPAGARSVRRQVVMRRPR